ncbi:MAG: hypothetical protein U5K71_15145 [Gracilimonas sp.]|nr:hypothetical protein [Gracilimonas sp.]
MDVVDQATKNLSAHSITRFRLGFDRLRQPVSREPNDGVNFKFYGAFIATLAFFSMCIVYIQGGY